MTRAEQLELEQLRRLVAAYRELLREAWRPVETTWDEVRYGQAVLGLTGCLYMVTRDGDETRVTNGGPWRPVPATPAATVRVLAPIPDDMTDLLLASELGAACARVDEEAAK